MIVNINAEQVKNIILALVLSARVPPTKKNKNQKKSKKSKKVKNKSQN